MLLSLGVRYVSELKALGEWATPEDEAALAAAQELEKKKAQQRSLLKDAAVFAKPKVSKSAPIEHSKAVVPHDTQQQ